MSWHERNAVRSAVRYPGVVIRQLVPAALALAAFFPAGARGATPAASALPPTSRGFVSADRAHDGGVVAGKIVRVDYVRGIMSLRKGLRTVDVYVLPSTNIQGKQNGYYTISDLKRGEEVEIFTSVAGSRTNAQIIKLK